MPVNRNALIRYRTIDNCLRNRQRRWTLEDLMDACSDALYEYEGIDKGVSRRSVQMDIQIMRSDKLGYNAPIIVLEKKFYTYEDPDYSITNIPLTDQDLGKLTEVVEILRQFKGFSHFQELSGMVQRLENKIHSAKTKQEPVIDFEKNENLKGLEYIETIYQAILKKRPIEMTYQSFKARDANGFTFHPYYLKEYRNRWFVLGVKKKNSPIMTLALDRIASIKESMEKYVESSNFNISSFFENVLGVTVNPDSPPERIEFIADYQTAPYILTKPIHHSQEVIQKVSEGVIFAIHVQINYELEREILGFGDRIKVIKPAPFKRRIKDQLENALERYQFDLSETALVTIQKKLEHKGFSILNCIYGKKEINAIRGKIFNYQKQNSGTELHAIRNILHVIPEICGLVFNANLLAILRKINRNLFLTKSLYFEKSMDANWYVTWHQDITINVDKKIETPGFSGWSKKSNALGVRPPEEILKETVTIRIHLDDTNERNGALKVIPGSHNKILTNDEINLICKNSIPYFCEIEAGGIQMMKPLLLHSSSKVTSQKPRRVIHLEFNSIELPNGLTWSEKMNVC